MPEFESLGSLPRACWQWRSCSRRPQLQDEAWRRGGDNASETCGPPASACRRGTEHRRLSRSGSRPLRPAGGKQIDGTAGRTVCPQHRCCVPIRPLYPEARNLDWRGEGSVWVRIPLLGLLFCGLATAAGLVTLIPALCYPSGWDELVYHAVLPRRWSTEGWPAFYTDLPYSGFPSSGEILFWLIAPWKASLRRGCCHGRVGF